VRAAAIVVLLALVACGGRPAGPEPATPFDLERLGGGRARLSDYRGKLLLLDFWATWCPPCVLEAPELDAFAREHHGRGVELLAISVEGDRVEALQAFVSENGTSYPIALGSEDLARRYGATSFPFHVLVSPDGHVLERLLPGYHDREELRALVARHTPR
jgi:thiol-disulfide isomerase/thioredoxin